MRGKISNIFDLSLNTITMLKGKFSKKKENSVIKLVLTSFQNDVYEFLSSRWTQKTIFLIESQ